MSISKFRKKLRGMSMVHVPDGLAILAIRRGDRWHATIEGEGIEARVDAKGIIDVVAKACMAWHKSRGTDLARLVTEKHALATDT